MILVFHTDGTAMWQWKLPGEHPAQPHLLRLAWLELHDDGGEDDAPRCLLIKPPLGSSISDEARAFHGIGIEDVADGVELTDALDQFQGVLARARGAVAYNLPFHQKMLNRAAAQLGRTLEWHAMGQCAMKLAAPVVRVKLQANNQWACPKFDVAAQHFLGAPLPTVTDPRAAGIAIVNTVRRIYEGCLQAEAA